MALKLLKRAAIQSIALMLSVITLSYAVSQYKHVIISASDKTLDDENSNEEDIIIPPEVGQEEEALPSNDIMLRQLSESYLKIKKPLGKDLTISFEDLYMTRGIKITITGMYEDSMKSTMVGRIRSNEEFYGEPSFTDVPSIDTNVTDETDETYHYSMIKNYGNDLAHGITITHSYESTTMLYTAELLIEMDHIYVTNLYEDEEYYYVDLRRPKDVYDKVIVVDAGHGGKDSGSISYNQQYYEKDINLSILQYLKEYLDQENIKVYYTRLSEEKVFLKPRVALANELDCDFFISIHCNANSVSSPKGTEVLYYDNNFKGVLTKDLASICQEELSNTILLEDRGLIKMQGDEIYILAKSRVPAIIIEVAFMTNQNDMQFLLQEGNRQLAAQGIYHGIMRAYEELEIKDNEQ